MKIWLINHYASMQYRDKSGRHFWFAKELKRRGDEPHVFCSSTFHDNNREVIDTGNAKFVVTEDADTNIPFVFVKTHLSSGNGLSRIRNMLDFYRHLFPVARAYIKRTGKPNVIIASSVHPLTMVAGVQLAKRFSIPCICEVRDLWPEAIFTFGKAKEESLLGRLLIAGEHWIYRRADALIFTKEGDTDYIKEKQWTSDQGGDIALAKCHYINNGIDLDVYRNRMRTNTLDDADLSDSTKFKITYAGIIRPVNNVGMILDCAKLLAEHTDIQFLIFGEGSQLAELRERVCKEQITNVKLKGFIERKYIPYVLSKSSINLLNYSQNQFNWSRGNSSNKLFEYMASGKPIISTVKMGYSLIDRYQCGLELNECTAEALAEAILTIKELPEEQYSMLGQNAAAGANDFDFKVLTTKLESVIRSVVQ